MQKNILVNFPKIAVLTVLLFFVFPFEDTPKAGGDLDSSEEMAEFIILIQTEGIIEKEIERKKQFLLAIAAKHDAETKPHVLEYLNSVTLTIPRATAENLAKQGYDVIENKPLKAYLW